MSTNLTHAERAATHLGLIPGIVLTLSLLARGAEAQSFVVYDDGLTRMNVGYEGLQVILRDNPNPPPNPTTVVLLDGFTNGPGGGQYHYRLEGSSVLDNRGGTLTNGGSSGSVDLYDTSRLIISGGSIIQSDSPAIRASGSSRTEISGGRLISNGFNEGPAGTGIGLSGNAQLEITGGEFHASSSTIIVSAGTSHATIDGGTFNASGIFFGSIVRADQSSITDILGGTFTSYRRGLDVLGNAVVNVRGGTFNLPTFNDQGLGGFFAEGNGLLNVFGGSFALDGSPVAPGFIPHTGRLTGILADGTPLDVLAAGRVFLVPEPAAWLLLVSGAVGIAAATKRRHS
jgi:hypothetical protein